MVYDAQRSCPVQNRVETSPHRGKLRAKSENSAPAILPFGCETFLHSTPQNRNTGMAVVLQNLLSMGQKLLLVEDEPDSRKLYADLLSSEGYEVRVATSGEEALGMINGYRPDAILLDVMLPGKSGIDVARELAHRSDTSEIPVVVITALNEFSTGGGLAAIPGIRRFIYKPCRPKTLIEGVEDAIRYHR